MAAIKSAAEAIAGIASGSRIMFGGFGRVGSPETLIAALAEHPADNLTVICNDLGSHNEGLGVLLLQNKIKKAIGSFFTPNPDAAKYYREGKLEIELIPQGNFAEAIRAAGAGLGGFLTPVGVGTELAKGRDVIHFQGREYILQPPLHADYALIRAKVADTLGNLVYSKSGRNFNPIMATAAKCCIAEVDEIVEAGELSPEEIITPFLYVDILVKRGSNDAD
ncbi:MAG: CoA transferase subunit A [Negativicutes bacterium]|nr:CoA transferase subunit A [Negativicutes bacterium]